MGSRSAAVGQRLVMIGFGVTSEVQAKGREECQVADP